MNLPSKLQKSAARVQLPRKYLLLGLSGPLLLLSTLLVGRIVRRHLIGQRVVLAAGNGTKL
ncbi:MAG: hypothetical protein AAFV46_12890 [Cyanobacteria bacterium J06635_11]